MQKRTSSNEILSDLLWRKIGKSILFGLLAVFVTVSAMLSDTTTVMAEGLDVGDVVKEVISSDSCTVADGVTYEEALFKTEDGRTVAGFMVDTNYGTEGSNLHIAVGMPNNGTEFAMQRVSDQMRYAAIDGRNVLAGVNADFYNMSTGEPEGLFVKDGIQVHAWTPSQEISNRLAYRTFFGILKDGTAIIGDKEVYEANKENLEQAVGGDYILVQNGVPRTFEGEDTTNMNDLPTGSYPRTCVGIRADGSVFFICVDGKRPDTYSAGLTLVEMAQLMVENGAVTAMNLDGGGSTTMVIKDPETQEYTLQNSPSDGTSGATGGTERSVANCLYVYNDEEPSIPGVTLDQDEDGYYLIRSVEDLAQINYDPRANYRLANDIDAAGNPVEEIKTFNGTLDGDGHTINNLLYASASASGLIGELGSNGVIENLTITNAVLETSASNVGILVGQSSGIIRNVNVSGVVTGSRTVGGLVGKISGTGIVIENCHVVADVTSQDSYAGILVAQNVSQTEGEITACSVKGTVSGGTGVGGLFGYVTDSDALWICDCMVDDTIVNGNGQHVGGLAGMAKCGVEHCFVSNVTVKQEAPNESSKHSASLLTGWHNFAKLSISNNVIYRSSLTTNNTANSHRVAEGSGTRENNYASSKIMINGEYRNKGDAYYEGITKTERELMVQSFYEGLGFQFGETGVWEWDSIFNIPVLKGSNFEIPDASPALMKDEEGYYLIDSADDFKEIDKDPGAKYRLANDLAVSEEELTSVDTFSGEFDGQGHSINGYSSSHPLFKNLQPGAVLQNVSIVNAKVESDDSYVAIAVGMCDGAAIRNVKVHGTVVNTTNNENGTAGLVGQLKSSSGSYLVENCSAQVDVTAPAGTVGVIFGQSITGAKGEIRACTAKGTVEGKNFVGGFGGRIMDSANVWVRDCVSSAQVSGEQQTGGFMGMAKGGVERCLVVDTDVQQESATQGSKYAACFIAGWHNYKQLSISNNVIYSGSITTTCLDKSFNIADGSGTRTNNYVSESLTINGAFRDTGNATYDGMVATAEQLTSQAFYEQLGFDFSEDGPWIWAETIPVLKGNEIEVSEKILKTEYDVLNVGSDETQRTLTWYSSASGDLEVQYVPVTQLTEDGQMPEDAIKISASAEASSISGKNIFRAVFTDLIENTEYAYRMGSEEEGWTEIRTFSTGSFGSFSFLLAGDPQIGSSGSVDNDQSGWQNTLNLAMDQFSDASFLLSLGDQVEHATSEPEYAAFLSTGDFQSLTLAAITGNHDSSSSIFKEHFSVPNPVVSEGDTAAGGDYWFIYNNTLVMCLNSNNLSTASHKQFMQDTLEAHESEVDWTVVTFHHSIYSSATHAFDNDIVQRRNELAPVFSELGIDVVLMGHDHVYTRSYMMEGTNPVIPEEGVTSSVTNPEEGQVLYITANSSSGSKFYSMQNAELNYAAVKNQENVPNISKVDVTDTSFTITTYRTTDMSVVDSFTIYRTEDKAVTGVELDKSEITLEEGESDTLTATVNPEDAANKNVIWTSSNPDVATVENGVVTAVGAGTATITVTTEDGEYTAVCTVTCTETEPTGLPFEDVPEGEWYYEYVADVYEKGLMTGLTENVFGPTEKLSRAQFAVILYRMEGAPEVAYREQFPDVADGQFYTEAVLWAAENGIVTGYTEGTFGPADEITREQMATMMYRYAKYKEYDVSAAADISVYPDAASVSAFAQDAVSWCVAEEIITGDNGALNPQGVTVRAVCATIISRFTEI